LISLALACEEADLAEDVKAFGVCLLAFIEAVRLIRKGLCLTGREPLRGQHETKESPPTKNRHLSTPK